MPESIEDKFKKTAKRLYEIYNPQGWLQIYYPLYYLDKAIKHDIYPLENQRKVVRLAVPGAIAYIIVWILWTNLRFILRDLFIRQNPQEDQASRQSDQNDDDYPTYKLSFDTRVPDQHLQTDTNCGLSQNEVKKRREIYGSNKLQTSASYFYVLGIFSAHGVAVPLEVTRLFIKLPVLIS